MTKSHLVSLGLLYEKEVLELSKSFGETNTLEYRITDLMKKVMYMVRKESAKNMADVFLSVLWLQEKDKAHQYDLVVQWASELLIECAIVQYSSNNAVSHLSAVIKWRIGQLQYRLKATGTTRNQHSLVTP